MVSFSASLSVICVPTFARATSALPPLIVFLTEKLNSSVCFLFPKKPVRLFGDPLFQQLVTGQYVLTSPTGRGGKIGDFDAEG